MKHLSEKPITDKEKQLTPSQAIGAQDMEMFRSPDLSSILNELLNTDPDKIALSTNIDKKRTLNTIVSMQTQARNTRTIFRNINPENPQGKAILDLIEYDANMIENQIADKLKAHKSLKGFTTNKIIEAIQARISRMDRMRSMFNRGQDGNKTSEAL